MKLMEIFFTFLRLGLTSFGGPVAHLSYFHNEFVKNKKWINEQVYAELVALCQFLPGPASSQVGMAIGFRQGGILGAILAWIAFTIPSAIILVLFAMGIDNNNFGVQKNWIHGLQIVAVSVVAHAILSMWKKLSPDKERSFMAIISTIIILYFKSVYIQIIVLVVAGIVGAYFLKTKEALPDLPIQNKSNKKLAIFFLLCFFVLLIFLPLLRSFYPYQIIKLFDSFYRAGSLVFGGGHVVLPLLENEVVPTGWVRRDLFMAGYGLAQAIPGPLFSFTAYLGSVSVILPNRWTGAIICLIAAFLPSFLLIIGVLPFWEKMRSFPRIKQSMLGVNASVVGILLAAFIGTVWPSAILSIKDFLIAIIGFFLLEYWKLSSWIVVLITVIASMLIV